MSRNAFECRDRDGTRVVCSRETWDRHIVPEHPEMKGCQDSAVETITSPYQVYQDKNFSARRILYRPFVLPRPYDQQYLRVVIEYKRRRLSKRYTGYVLTAFPVQNRRKGDILLWSRF